MERDLHKQDLSLFLYMIYTDYMFALSLIEHLQASRYYEGMACIIHEIENRR